MEKTNLSVAPYWDDYDETKNFHRILIRPDAAIQSRELTQLQTILQAQIDRFGSHIFKNGSPVKDGQTTVDTGNVVYIVIDALNGLLNVDVADFIDQVIVIKDTPRAVKARVIAVADTEGTDGKTLMVRYIGGEAFAAGDILAFEATPSIAAATIPSGNVSGTKQSGVEQISPVGQGSIAAINDGIFFVRGYFVRVAKQIIILDKYTTAPTYKVGLEIDEIIVTSSTDTSLLDPALDASNYQAPGAHRFKIALTYSKRAENSIDEDDFISLLKVVNGAIVEQVRYPVYGEIENVLARRTKDESGSYTVKDFRVRLEESANTANIVVVVDPGKAYVEGFEFETIAPTRIESPKARDTATIDNYNVTMNYGNYLMVQNTFGAFSPESFANVELHVAPQASIDFATANNYANTKIGTARVRQLAYETATDASNANTYVYRMYVFDVATSNAVFSNAGVNSATTLTLPASFSSYSNTYDGVALRITGGSGSGQRRTIVGYNGASQLAYVDSAFTTGLGVDSVISLDYQFKDTESLVIRRGGKTAAADVATSYKSGNDAVIVDSDFNALIFSLPQSFVVPESLTPTSYTIRKKATLTAAANVFTLPTLSSPETYTADPATGTVSKSDASENFRAVITTVGSGTFPVGQLIPFGASNVAVVLSGGTSGTITVPNAGNAVIDLYYKTDVGAAGVQAARKTKTEFDANTTHLNYVGSTVVDNNGNTVLGATLNLQRGQLTLNTSNTIVKTPGSPQSLYTPDVIRLVKVVDSGNSTPVTSADLSNISKDITSRYAFDNGARDGYFDHASIRLKPGQIPPLGCIAILFDRYQHSGTSYATVDSYPNTTIPPDTGYKSVPTYVSSAGVIFKLRDSIDMRPVRMAGTSANGAYNFGTVTIGAAGTDMELSFDYFLPRIDKLIVTSTREFEVIHGVSSIVPTAPRTRAESMLLYTLNLPAYTANTQDVFLQKTDNRRYTMRDIGALDQRITNLEYYTALSLLEQRTINSNDLSLLDDAGLTRAKNGILVDTFQDFSVADALVSDDFTVALDTLRMQAHPAQSNMLDIAMKLDPDNSTDETVSGPRVSIVESANTKLVTQDKMSTTVNINPFAVTRWNASLQLDPTMDTWTENTNATVLTVDQADPNLAGSSIDLGITWSPWETLYYGTTTQGLEGNQYDIRLAAQNIINTLQGPITTASNGEGQWDVTVRTHSGVRRTASFQTVTTNQGTRVINVTVVPYIRKSRIVFRCEHARPNTTFYPYFDGTDMRNRVQRANVIKIKNGFYEIPFNEEIEDTYGDPQPIQIGVTTTPQDKTTYTANAIVALLTYSGSANSTNERVGMIIDSTYLRGFNRKWGNTAVYSNTAQFANNAAGKFSGISKAVIGGSLVTSNAQIIQVEHYSGNVRANSNTTQIFVDPSIANSHVYIDGVGLRAWRDLTGVQPWSTWNEKTMLRIVAGPVADLGESFSTIDQFVLNNGNPYFTLVTPLPYAVNGSIDTNHIYSIGLPYSLATGAVSGILHVPATTIKTGQRLVKLTDDPDNNDTSASAIAVGEFTASGLSQTTQTTLLVTREQRVTETLVHENEVLYTDPLAQSVGIDKTTYPNGVFLKSIRVLFSQKDDNLPIRLQIRPMVNGFPDSKRFLTERTLSSDKVKTINTATLVSIGTTNTKAFDETNAYYTEFVFESPVYLAPGEEYALVMISDSNNYRVWVSEIGQTDVRTGSMISTQPYLGSLFKSQNQTTWTPEQTQDLAFQAVIATFDTSKTANICFNIDTTRDISTVHDLPASANVDMFFYNLQSIVPPGTTTNFKYAMSLENGNVQPNAKELHPLVDTYFEDQNGRRKFTKTNENSFKVFAELTTTDPYVSPYIDIGQGMSVKTTELFINNGELSNSVITISNGGAGYVAGNAANMWVSITGGGGSGANGKIATINPDGTLGSITLDAVGSGYYTTPTITIGYPPGFGGTNASAVVIGETSPNGGNMYARYITKAITLATGFDSSDLRVYVTAYKPQGSNIYVYYKVLSAEDPAAFEDKNWQLMTQLGNVLTVSSNKSDVREFTYAPGTGGTQSNEIFYDSYGSFKTFAIKIVMATNDPINAPFLNDMRAIALPSGKL